MNWEKKFTLGGQMMTDQVYQMVQYPLKKVIRILSDLEDIDSLPPEQLAPESRAQLKEDLQDFIEFWENGGREDLKNLINGLREKME